MGKQVRCIAFLVCILFQAHGAFASDPKQDVGKIMGDQLPKAKLLILGTFHFKDAGMDSYKPQHHVDIFSAKRQAELKEVIALLAQFKPTKVAVEWKPNHQEKVDQRFQEYVNGTFKLKANEVYQLGFRLAKRMGHPRVHLVDAKGRWYERVEDAETFAKQHHQTDRLNSPWDARYETYYQFKDALKMKLDLRAYFIDMNSEEALLRSHGHYLVGGFSIGDGETFPGVDGFVSSWYNRNLRIFANLTRLIESPKERILLIIGAGHVPILRHAAQASPEIELVEVADVLGKK